MNTATFVASVIVLAVALASAQRVPLTGRVTVSDNSGNRLKWTQNLTWSNLTLPSGTCSAFGKSNGAVCFGSSSALRQEIDGFGGSFLRSGAILLNQLSPATQQRLLVDLFDPVVGAGFRVGKVPIGATDFQPPVWYTYEDAPGVFTVAHDLEPDGTIPYIKRAAAVAGRNITLQSTMDYPPAWMRNMSTPLPKAQINTTFFPALAKYFLSFAQQFEANGVPIAFIDMFNEPVESYSNVPNDQLADLLSNYVGPLFASASGTVPLVSWGAQFGRITTAQEYTNFMHRPDVAKWVQAGFYHGYDCYWECSGPGLLNTTCPGLSDAMAAIENYIAQFPNLKFWMSEVCYALEAQNYPDNASLCPPLPRSDFEDMLQWGRMMFGDLSAGASAFIYWNMILDTQGGPFLVSVDHNDPYNNSQHPLVIADVTKDSYVLTGAYFALAHFGRFVVPGMRRVTSARSGDLSYNVWALAFVDPVTSRYVVQLMNDQLSEATVSIVFDGAFAGEVTLPPVSIVSVEFDSVPGPSGNNGNNNGGAAPWVTPVLVTGLVLLAIVLGVVGYKFFTRSSTGTSARTSLQETDYRAQV